MLKQPALPGEARLATIVELRLGVSTFKRDTFHLIGSDVASMLHALGNPGRKLADGQIKGMLSLA